MGESIFQPAPMTKATDNLAAATATIESLMKENRRLQGLIDRAEQLLNDALDDANAGFAYRTNRWLNDIAKGGA